MTRIIFYAVLTCFAIKTAFGEEDTTKNGNRIVTLDWATPVLNAMICPLTKDPWDCGRQQASRMIDVFLADVEQTKQEIKDDADADLAERIASRAFSESELPEKEKPSAVMTVLDSYITNSILSFMGRKNANQITPDRKPHDQHMSSGQNHGGGEHQHEHKPHSKPHNKPQNKPQPQVHEDHYEEDHEDDEHEDDDSTGDELLQFEGHHGVGHAGGSVGHRKPHHGAAGHPVHHKYGRDLGVTRGKKHKKKFKKALMKLLVLAAVLKVKLEFFLKVLATHLQVKFFIVAFLGLLLNAAKFWIDLKKGHSPQKVIYYEHAQHQHHYDDHGDDGWGGGGGYWKRSFDTEDVVDDSDTDAAMLAYRQSRGIPSISQQKP